jgi:hypothetical protein
VTPVPAPRFVGAHVRRLDAVLSDDSREEAVDA